MPFDNFGRYIPEDGIYGPDEAFGPPQYDASEHPYEPTPAARPEPTPQEVRPPQTSAPEKVNDSQYDLADRTGIKTYGPRANDYKQDVRDYLSGEHEYGVHTGQGRPMQYGVEEAPFGPEGPRDPAETASLMMARGVPKRDPNRHMETPAEIKARNASYEEYIQKDRASREAERQARRQRATENRMDAREKDSDMWASLRGYNAIQGAGPSASPQGGYGAINAGGAIILPGMGRHGYGPHGEDSSLGWAKLEEQRLERERRGRKDTTTSGIAQARVGLAEQGLNVRRAQLEAEQRHQAALLKLKEQGINADKSEVVATGVDSVATLAADIDHRLQYAKEKGDHTATDTLFDEKGKPAGVRPGELRKRIDLLLNRIKELDQIDPEWDSRVSDATDAVIKRVISAYRSQAQSR